MLSVKIPIEAFKELTSLEKALELAIDKEKWYTHKQKYLGLEKFDEKIEDAIWEDFNYLMVKAVNHHFEPEDYEVLQNRRSNRVDPSPFEPYTDMRYFPTEILSRDEEGNIESINVRYVNIEMTAALFDHIFDILVGRVDVRQCEADDCNVLFIPKRKHQKYCSQRCQQRQAKRRQAKQNH